MLSRNLTPVISEVNKLVDEEKEGKEGRKGDRKNVRKLDMGANMTSKFTSLVAVSFRKIERNPRYSNTVWLVEQTPGV